MRSESLLIVGQVINQPPRGGWAPRGRLEAFVVPRMSGTREFSHSLGEFQTYAQASDAILNWRTLNEGVFPRNVDCQIRYLSYKCSDWWSALGTKDLRDWCEFLDLKASEPKGPDKPPGYYGEKIHKAQTRKWFPRRHTIHVHREPPDADGNPVD
jgi:hypothetical protein